MFMSIDGTATFDELDFEVGRGGSREKARAPIQGVGVINYLAPNREQVIRKEGRTETQMTVLAAILTPIIRTRLGDIRPASPGRAPEQAQREAAAKLALPLKGRAWAQDAKCARQRVVVDAGLLSHQPQVRWVRGLRGCAMVLNNMQRRRIREWQTSFWKELDAS
jgi:hypothetical protein